MKRRGRVGVVVAGASLLLWLGGCTRASRPAPSPGPTTPADAPADAAPSEEAEAVDLEALIADPAAALPGTPVRHGRYDFRRLRDEGGFVVARTEALEVHALGSRLVGRVTREGERSPPSVLVFLTDAEGRLAQLVWRGLPGRGDVEHEFGEITARSDGATLEVVRKRGLSTSTQRVTVPGAWTLDVALALEQLPLWSVAAAAPPAQGLPAQVEWVAIDVSPEAKPERVRLAQRGKETLAVGGHEIDTWRYQTAGTAPLSAMLWVDAQGWVVRRLDQAASDEGTQWDTIYVPLAGDRLSR
jgi:hypothetical protein